MRDREPCRRRTDEPSGGPRRLGDRREECVAVDGQQRCVGHRPHRRRTCVSRENPDLPEEIALEVSFLASLQTERGQGVTHKPVVFDGAPRDRGRHAGVRATDVVVTIEDAGERGLG
jgi:hypothetical protein